jgi:hypothetical protein
LTRPLRTYGREKDNLFNKCYPKNWIDICRKMKLNPFLSQKATQNASQNYKLNTRKQAEELLQDIDTGNIFLVRTQKMQVIKVEVEKLILLS